MSDPDSPQANATGSVPPAGYMSHKAEDVARILDSLHSQGRVISAFVGENDGQVHTCLLFVDPGRGYIVVASPGETAAGPLLARSHVNFFSEFNGWHVEFSAADPQATTLGGEAAIRLRFPEVIASQQQRRMEPRIEVSDAPLRCEADSAGFAPFDGQLVDISRGGIGLLLYGADITLAPGTILKGCRIDLPGKGSLDVDLEVRYTKPVMLDGGHPANRSGCRFLNPTRRITELIDSFNPDSAAN